MARSAVGDYTFLGKSTVKPSSSTNLRKYVLEEDVQTSMEWRELKNDSALSALCEEEEQKTSAELRAKLNATEKKLEETELLLEEKDQSYALLLAELYCNRISNVISESQKEQQLEETKRLLEKEKDTSQRLRAQLILTRSQGSRYEMQCIAEINSLKAKLAHTERLLQDMSQALDFTNIAVAESQILLERELVLKHRYIGEVNFKINSLEHELEVQKRTASERIQELETYNVQSELNVRRLKKELNAMKKTAAEELRKEQQKNAIAEEVVLASARSELKNQQWNYGTKKHRDQELGQNKGDILVVIDSSNGNVRALREHQISKQGKVDMTCEPHAVQKDSVRTTNVKLREKQERFGATRKYGSAGSKLNSPDMKSKLNDLSEADKELCEQMRDIEANILKILGCENPDEDLRDQLGNLEEQFETDDFGVNEDIQNDADANVELQNGNFSNDPHMDTLVKGIAEDYDVETQHLPKNEELEVVDSDMDIVEQDPAQTCNVEVQEELQEYDTSADEIQTNANMDLDAGQQLALNGNDNSANKIGEYVMYSWKFLLRCFLFNFIIFATFIMNWK